MFVMAAKYSFGQGDVVLVRGMAGEHRVAHMVLIPVPTITRFKFEMVEREMAKFVYGKDFFYAWVEDLTLAPRKGAKK
jgi:hypothetical protein